MTCGLNSKVAVVRSSLLTIISLESPNQVLYSHIITVMISRGVLDLLLSSLVGTRKTQPYALMVETQTSQHHRRNSTSTVRLYSPSRLPTRLVPIRQPTRLLLSKNPTDAFFKISNFSAHRFRSWCHSHSSPISYLALWLSYPLRASVNCAQCLCTWTKSRIVRSPNKLNDKISSSSSSSRAASTDIPDPLSPRLLIIHHLRQVFRVTSRIIT